MSHYLFRGFYLRAFRRCRKGHYLYLRFVVDSAKLDLRRGAFEPWYEHQQSCDVCGGDFLELEELDALPPPLRPSPNLH
jgi:hypothetical protein